MPPERRSRRGCKQCRAGHHKCDEATPSCSRCRTRGLECGYTSRIRWGSIVTVTSESRRRTSRAVSQDILEHESSSSAPRQASSPPDDLALLSHTSPLVFQQPEEITAYTYYIDRLAGELQAQDSLHNPYRKLSVLALNFPVLLHTILSCAAEHMHISGLTDIQLAITQHERAIRSLRAGLAEWKRSGQSQSRASAASSQELVVISADQALLAAILLQPAIIAFSGSAASSVHTHLDMAFYILNELKYLDSAPMIMDSFIPRLLIQRFAIVDLALSVYHRRRPRMPLDNWFAKPSNSNALDGTQPAFCEMTGCSHMAFTFLLRAIHLAADLAYGSRLKKDIHSDAISLETDVRIYDRSGPGPSSSDGLGRSPESTSVNPMRRAFSHAALLLLFRRVFAEPPCSPRVQHTISVIFASLDSIPTSSTATGASGTHSGVDSASGLPFFLAAREAVTAEDQNWVRKKHAAWRKVYPNPARVRLMEVAEKIWQEREKGTDGVEQRCKEVEKSCETYIF